MVRESSPIRTALPVVDQPPAERADAARNRQVLLAAARTLLASSGVDALSLDRLAAQAGMGVGTVYRRFGDRAGLAYALLDEEERRFQQAFLTGPPPLGPGAPAAARVRAFMHAYVDRLELQADLHALAEVQAPTARHRKGAYQTHRTHLMALLRTRCPPADAAYLADALLGTLGAGLFIHQHRERGWTLEEIKRGIDRLVSRLVPDEPHP